MRATGSSSQVADDHYSFTEDQSSGTFLFDVRANDGLKKSLHSIDNGQVADLATMDFPSSAGTSNDRSALGATIWINSEGRVGYSAANISGLIEGLAHGEVLVDSFLYSMKQGNNIVWATATITITGTNDAPVASADFALVSEDSLAAGSVAANDHDVDHGAVLQFAATGTLPAGFAMASDGSWALDGSNAAYQSLGAGETLTLNVSYTVTDEHGASANAALQLTVTGTNDAPAVTGAVTGAGSEDGPSSALDALANASDADGPSSMSVVDVPTELPPGVSYDPTTGSFTFDPSHAAYQSLADGATVTVSVSYGVSDGSATTPASVSWTVTGTNDGPVAIASAAAVAEDQAVSGTLVATDVDEGSSLVFEPYFGGPDGFILNSDGSWTFDANLSDYQSLAEGEIRDVAIDYVVTDDHGEISVSTLTVTVAGANDAPVTTSQWAEAVEGETATGTLFALDQDNDAELTFAVVGEAPAGFTLNADGSWAFDGANGAYDGLANGEVQLVEVNFSATDEHGAAGSSFMTIAVTGTNDAPALTGTATVLPNGTEDTSFSFTPQQLLAGWTDAEGSALQVTNLAVDRGTLFTKPDGSWFVQPTFDYNGPVTLSYQVSDGTASTAATLTVNVAPVNDAPRYNTGIFLPTQVEDVNFTLTQQQLLNGWTDPEGAAMTVTNVTFNRGTVTANGDGSFAFRLNADINGSAIAFVTVSDGQLARTQQISFTITPVADPARITGPTSGSLTEDLQSRVTGNLNSIEPDNAADNDKWTFQTTSASDNGFGTFSVTSAGVWTYDLNGANPAVNALNNGETLTDTFTVRTVDGTAQLITITINGSTDYTPPPVSTAADENDFDLDRADQELPSTLFHYSATAADDLVDGSVSFDIVDGNGGADTLYGHGGNDTLYGEIDYPSRLQQLGVTGNDQLYGQSGNDQLYGNGGNDTLYGGSGVDTLYGDDDATGSPAAGNDTLYGGSGNDTLRGEGGDDILVGGTGADMMFGGTGADRFAYTKGADTGDWILDFQRGTDLVDLSVLGLSSSDFIGALGARGAVGAGQAGYWVQAGTTELYLYVDTDGVTGADLEVHISGNNQFSASDIFWG